VATFARREAGAPRLAEALAALPPDLDVALVEGFSWEPIPRVVIAARGDSRLRTHLLSGEVLAVHTAAAGGGAPPRFETGWLEALVEAIAARARRARRAPPRRRASPAEIPRAPASGETPRL
jgi:molybdopterin-guanine dinucleotide biosynthesis protein